MTLVEEAHSLKQEEVLPLIGALELDISSPSKAAKDHVKRPLLQRIRQQLRHVTPELVAIALGKSLVHASANNRSMETLLVERATCQLVIVQSVLMLQSKLSQDRH